jgi:hypothetical protein
MALEKCKECGQSISTKADRCPHCGVGIRRTSVVTKTLAWLFGATIVVAIIGSLTEGHRKDEQAAAEQQRLAAMTPEQRAAEQKERAAAAAAAAREEDLNSARWVCKEFVTKTLHDPASAEFENHRSFWAKAEKGDVYHVRVQLRARNAFNALRKTVVDCRTAKRNGNWYPLSVKELK